ncbi:glycosyltransferase family 4 protein [Streptomyces sp. WMMB303]|uniref:glycosyltransferase family 4 protein n=1 Tax=Streptomyces sp. WMMB303 TaxID=3034154 RepID=UPI0023EB022F|nr:glycosyltransferase family 4 protein [Streptomyces sp. WMMB303]MDF4250976.1 glycosyltransferase family 4 protein [Streptomyces sp. WMMB303]
MEFDSGAGTGGTPGAEQPAAPAGRRGRIVMLVCNGVEGDSRVQKTARSAAAAGWEVVLLGRSPDGRPASWRLGGAQVRLLPVPTPLDRPPRTARRPLLTRPLAYRPGTAPYRAQRVKAWRDELRTRRAALAADRRSVPYAAVRLAGPRAAARLAQRWVAFRTRQLDRGTALRGAGTPLDRAAVAGWRRVRKERCWRRLWPGLYDFELAYGRVVDELRPDLIHAHDFRMLGVGARAKVRAAAAGRPVKLVWDAHEYLPGVRPWQHDVRWLPAHLAHEREYAPCADAAVTVSGTLAALLREAHGLAEEPAVVLNAPEAHTTTGPTTTGPTTTGPTTTGHPAPASTRPRAADSGAGGVGEADGGAVPSLRALCGIGAGTPLVVYSGAAAPQRGLGTMVEALADLPEAHTALVVPRPSAPYLRELRARAAELGAAERLHVLPYVPYRQVVPFLAEADAGAIPLHHWTNHEIALITKFFEYAHARLPLVVSDVRTMAATTRETGQGEVFRAEDTADYVRAVRAVLGAPERYRAAYERPGLLEQWTWEAQARTLDRIYARLLHQAAPERPDHQEQPEGDGNADLRGGAREDRAATGRPVRGQGASGDGRGHRRARGRERQRRGGAVPR